MTTNILGIFARSPFKSLQTHMDTVEACAHLLAPFFDAVQKGDFEQAATIHTQIRDKEHEADELKKEIRLHLPNSLLMPVSRGDLLQLLTVQDNIANLTKDISGLVLGRELMVPESIQPGFIVFLEKVLKSITQAKRAISEIDDLLETGFKGKEAKVVSEMILHLDDLEDETDQEQVRVRAGLFAVEQELYPVNVMFLYKIIDYTGSLADIAQQVGHRLQLLLAK